LSYFKLFYILEDLKFRVLGTLSLILRLKWMQSLSFFKLMVKKGKVR
jgi:hypothetical protein